MVSSTPSTNDESTAHKTLFDKGLKIRYEVAGTAYVDAALAAGSSEFARPMQELATEAWGPSLRRTSVVINNGATDVEIRETILQAAIYCGMPAGIEGVKIAEKVIVGIKAEKEKGQ